MESQNGGQSSMPHQLSTAEAEVMTNAYKNNPQYEIPGGTKSLGGYFFRSAFDDILAQADCAGIAYYFTVESRMLKIILVGTKSGDYFDMYNGRIAGYAQEPFRPGQPVAPVNHSVTLVQASALTRAYRLQFPAMPLRGYFFREILDYAAGLPDVGGFIYQFGENAAGLKIILRPFDNAFNEISMSDSGGERFVIEVSNGGGGGNNPLNT